MDKVYIPQSIGAQKYQFTYKTKVKTGHQNTNTVYDLTKPKIGNNKNSYKTVGFMDFHQLHVKFVMLDKQVVQKQRYKKSHEVYKSERSTISLCLRNLNKKLLFIFISIIKLGFHPFYRPRRPLG